MTSFAIHGVQQALSVDTNKLTDRIADVQIVTSDVQQDPSENPQSPSHDQRIEPAAHR